MTDKREQILDRLVAVLEDVDGVGEVERNIDIADEVTSPTIVVYDGDEEAEELGLGQAARRAHRVTMTPEVWVALGAHAESVGTDLNTMRARIIKAVVEDTQLATICGPNGNLRYRGLNSALHRARSVIGVQLLTFSFTYVLKASEL